MPFSGSSKHKIPFRFGSSSTVSNASNLRVPSEMTLELKRKRSDVEAPKEYSLALLSLNTSTERTEGIRDVRSEDISAITPSGLSSLLVFSFKFANTTAKFE